MYHIFLQKFKNFADKTVIISTKKKIIDKLIGSVIIFIALYT